MLRGGGRCGRFLVEEGNVVFHRSPAAEDDIVAFRFLHSVVAAVFRQRGYLVLHANAALREGGKAVVLSGDSGAGKSTTLAGLLARGYKMLSDDITILRASIHNRMETLPGIPQFHLTEEAANRLGHDVPDSPRFSSRFPKRAIAAAESMANEPAELGCIYLIEKGPVEVLRFDALQGMEKFLALQRCVYGPFFPGEHPEAFPIFGLAARQARLVRIRRPALGWTLESILSRIDLEGGD